MSTQYDSKNSEQVQQFINIFQQKQTSDVVKVQFEKYERYTSTSIRNRQYKGTASAILNKLHDNHGYGEYVDDFDDEPTEEPTFLKSFQALINSNGDGCDFIFTISINDHILCLGENINTEIEDCDE